MEEFDETIQPFPIEEPTHTQVRTGLYVTDKMQRDWSEIYKWTILLSAYGLLSIIMLTVGISAFYQQMQEILGSSMIEDSMPWVAFLASNLTAVMAIAIVASLLIYLFHLLFALKIRQAMQHTDQKAFQLAWSHLLNHIRLFCIVVIAGLLSYFVLLAEVFRLYSGIRGVGHD